MKQIKEHSRFVRYRGYETYTVDRFRKLKTEKGVCKQNWQIINEDMDYKKTLGYFKTPVPVAAPSKAQICGSSPAEIVGSNPAGGMGVCLL